mmetsp:Transcript_28086/g.56284  ORF Transcript_28086/g.56284 Transcript_28086/m.56284 type:complete len:357 (-) Transcript_28086:252-1322(-)
MAEVAHLRAVDGVDGSLGDGLVPDIDPVGQCAREHDAFQFIGALSIVHGGELARKTVERVRVVVRKGLEDEAAVDKVAGLFIVFRQRNEPDEGFGRGRQLLFRPGPDHVQFDGFPALEEREGDTVVQPRAEGPVGERAVVGDLPAGDVRQNIVFFQHPVARVAIQHVGNQHAPHGIVEAVVPPQMRVAQLLRPEPVVRKAPVPLRAGRRDAPQKMLDDRRRNYVPRVLRVGHALKCDPHQPAAIVEGGPPGVPRVDGGVDRHGQQRPARLAVRLALDAAHDAGRHGELVAPHGEARDKHHRAERGDVDQRRGVHVAPELVVGADVHLQEGQVAVVADRVDPGGALVGIFHADALAL